MSDGAFIAAANQARPIVAGRAIGIGLVLALHVAIGYALVHGLARKEVDIARPPIVASIVDQAPPKPPEPPAPPPPSFAPPPQMFVPPPEVRIKTPPPPTTRAVTAVTAERPPPAPPPAPVAVAAPPAPPPREPVRIGPRLDGARSSEPEYPPASRRLGEQGFLIVQVLVDAGGRPTEVKVQQSSGFPRLDQAAVTGIKEHYRFVPGSIDGRPEAMWFTFKFTWKLK